MKQCLRCYGTMVEDSSKTLEGVEYKYFKCKNCGEELLDMEQVTDVQEKYKAMKKKLKVFHE